MSERRSHEYVTKEGRGVIHTKWATDAFRRGWERTFGKRKKVTSKEMGNRAVQEGSAERQP